MIGTTIGGIGLFLLGMILLTEGLKSAAGDALRRVLTRRTGGPIKALLSGVAVTALVQSSSATTLTSIGFVSAGLLAFPQAVGVILGATVRLMTHGRTAAIGLATAGFSLLFVGIDMLQVGMSGMSDSARSVGAAGPDGRRTSHRSAQGARGCAPWVRSDTEAPAEALSAIAADIADTRLAHRRRLLERTAVGQQSPEAGVRELDTARWLESAAHHVWRAVHYLSNERTAPDAAGTADTADEPEKV